VINLIGGESMSQEYFSRTNGFLREMPEILSRFPGKGNIAINVKHYDSLGKQHYIVEVGERVNDSFVLVGQSTGAPVPEGLDTDLIIGKELEPFGDKARIFDVFVNSKLYREAKQ
jgi:hypothetical protein